MLESLANSSVIHLMVDTVESAHVSRASEHMVDLQSGAVLVSGGIASKRQMEASSQEARTVLPSHETAVCRTYVQDQQTIRQTESSRDAALPASTHRHVLTTDWRNALHTASGL